MGTILILNLTCQFKGAYI